MFIKLIIRKNVQIHWHNSSSCKFTIHTKIFHYRVTDRFIFYSIHCDASKVWLPCFTRTLAEKCKIQWYGT